MATIYVQFSDASKATIISTFASPQDPVVWPNQGVIDSSDSLWASYYGSQTYSAQKMLPAPTS